MDRVDFLEDEIPVEERDLLFVLGHVGRGTVILLGAALAPAHLLHHRRIQFFKGARPRRHAHLLRLVVGHQLKPVHFHHLRQILEIDQVLGEDLVDGLLVHLNAETQGHFRLRKCVLVVILDNFRDFGAVLHEGPGAALGLLAQAVKDGLAVVRRPDEIAAHPDAVAHIAQETVQDHLVLKEVVDGELARPHVKPGLAHTVGLENGGRQCLRVLVPLPENRLHVPAFGGAGKRVARMPDVLAAVAHEEEAPGHVGLAVFLALAQIPGTGPVKRIMNIVPRHVQTQHEFQSARVPFRQIPRFPTGEIHQLLPRLRDPLNQPALDIQIMEIAQSLGIGILRLPVVIHVVLCGWSVGNTLARGQHAPRDGLVNGCPVVVRHVETVAVIMHARAKLGRLVVPHPQRHPLPRPFPRQVVPELHNHIGLKVVALFGHHDPLFTRHVAQRHVTEAGIGVVGVRRLKHHRLVFLLVVRAPLPMTGGKPTVQDVVVGIAVVLRVIPTLQYQCLVLGQRLGTVQEALTWFVQVAHFFLAALVVLDGHEEINGIVLGRFPFEGMGPGDFLRATGLADAVGADPHAGRSEDDAVGVIGEMPLVYFSQQFSTGGEDGVVGIAAVGVARGGRGHVKVLLL